MITDKKVLIVDDDISTSELLSLHLQKEHFQCETVSDGIASLNAFKVFQPNLILLDLMLPGMDGYDICRELRKTSDVPIIMLSAKDEIFDKVLGLELGADDYIIKPFDPRELVARIKAVLRRYNPVSVKYNTQNIQDLTGEYVAYPDLIISLSNYTVQYMNISVDIPPKELELFYFLAKHPNQVFTREQLLDQLWGYEYIGDTRTVDVHIKRLREKFNNHSDWNIATVWGIGYKFYANPR